MRRWKKLIPSEKQEQKTLVHWATLQGIITVHSPNEGKRSVIAGRSLKEQGLKSGFPDIFAPYVNMTFSGLFIEVKQNREYTPSEKRKQTWVNQEWWLNYLNSQGYYATRCYGWERGAKIILDYMANKILL